MILAVPRGFLGAVLAALLLTACAAPERRPWTEGGPSRAAPEAAPRLPDLPDAFRAELRAGQNPDCLFRGQAVHLGNGRFLTAAHLVDGVIPKLRHCAGPTIRFAGRMLAVRPVRVGEGHIEPGVGPVYRNGRDLALVQAAVVPPGPAARPCGAGPVPGQAVLVLTTGRKEEVLAGTAEPEHRKEDGAYVDLPISLAEGESGSGVFDARTNCLLGIVSHRPDARPGHVRIVPAGIIRDFLDG